MSSPLAIRAGLKAALDRIVLPQGFQVVEYQLDVPTPPTIQFFPEQKKYHQAGSDGLSGWQWCVQAFVGFGIAQAAQMTLDSFLEDDGPTSIKAALEFEPTLGGACGDLIVISNEGYQLFVNQRQVVLGSSWTVGLAA